MFDQSKQRPENHKEWDNYFVWLETMILKINPEERYQYRRIADNVYQSYRKYLTVEHQASLKSNPTVTKAKASSMLEVLYEQVDILGDLLLMSRLASRV